MRIMKTVSELTKFVSLLEEENNILGGKEYFQAIREQLSISQRMYASTNTSYVIEIPKEDFVLWLQFKENKAAFEEYKEERAAIARHQLGGQAV